MNKKLRNYFYTITNLKPVQIFNRVLRRFKSINLQTVPLGLVTADNAWQNSDFNAQSFYPAEQCFEFLNRSVKKPAWNDSTESKLWLYNLHYFDDLNAVNACERKAEHTALMAKWIDENPAAMGNGWEPYPLSLRVSNWLKWQLSGNALSQAALQSLGLQCHVLSQSLEYHLLGNHLFANAKALLFAGVCLQGKSTDAWCQKGQSILLKELDEQFLSDGANFELSPMYHAILLVDCLDIVNLAQAYPGRISQALLAKLQVVISKALHWLTAMSHGDGEIGFFNDATFGIAWKNADIFAYAQRLGFPVYDALGVNDLTASGFVSVKQADYSLLADLAEIGPCYIPGHAHADTLSFEWCLQSQRVFVNNGISEYGISPERLRQRQTPAHNTVTANGLHSTEVWSGFRVARRAHIVQREVAQEADTISFCASHDGFKRQGLNCLHQRSFRLAGKTLTIIDQLLGDLAEGRAYFHLHPGVTAELLTPGLAEIMVNGHTVTMAVEGGSIHTEASRYHPGFGISLPAECLVVRFDSGRLQTLITW